MLAPFWAIYVWHRLNHRVPWLGRFHLVHHADLIALPFVRRRPAWAPR